MNPILMAGSIIVTFALISYSVAILTEQIKHVVSNRTLTFLTIGITLDIIATALMIIGSPNSPFTLHGLIGYSSLTLMLIDTVLIWRFRLKNSPTTVVSRPLHLYSRIAYTWWVLAYITGGLLVALK